MADGHDFMLSAPVGYAAVHCAAPGLRQSIAILILGGGLVFTGQLELVSRIGLFPVHLPFGKNSIQFRAPVAAGLRLIIEKARDNLAEVVFEPVIMRLIDGLDKPLDTIAAGAIDTELAILSQCGGLLVGELHDLPAALRNLPAEFAVLNRGGCIHQGIAEDFPVGIHLAGKGCNIIGAAVTLGFIESRAFHIDRGCFQLLGGILRRDIAADTLAGPPFFVEYPHFQATFAGRLKADRQVIEPAGAEPVFVRAGFGGKAAVAAFGDNPDIILKPLGAFVAMQPEQGAGPLANLGGQGTKVRFKGFDTRRGVK